jgi:hypothetical protein
VICYACDGYAGTKYELLKQQTMEKILQNMLHAICKTPQNISTLNNIVKVENKL